MKLIRLGAPSHEIPAIVDAAGAYRDISALVADLSADTLSPSLLDRLRDLDLTTCPVIPKETRVGPCVGRVGKLICIGLNYADHAAEAGMELPKEPIVFMKAPTAICGPNDPIELPRGSEKTDWELELGVVIGQRAKYVSPDDALSHVFGYCAINDVSERGFQLERGGQWVKGKSHDSFAPLGPWLVTADEIPDPQSLSMTLSVNERVFQNGSTATMVFGVAYLVSYLSQFMTLMPGDVISTGTPPGVGMGQKPPVYLRAGDVVRARVAGLGQQEQVCQLA